MKTVNIAILGLGTVGGGTYEILKMNRELIEKRTGIDFRVTRALEKNTARMEQLGLDPAIAVSDPDIIFNDPEIDIVVEALGGIEPSSTFMEKALLAGKGVVSPNKAAVAASYARLREAEAKGGGILRFEACVGGGIPALTAIQEALAGNEFLEVMGIVNGTTNYILTKMTEEGLPYDEVL